jgi:uncharacterized membrane protein YqiK
MSSNQLMIVGVVLAAVVLVLGFLAMLARFYRLVDQGRALIKTGVGLGGGEPHVTFTGPSSTAPRSWTSRSRPSRSTAAGRRA